VKRSTLVRAARVNRRGVCRAGGAHEGVSRRAPVNRRGGEEEGGKGVRS